MLIGKRFPGKVSWVTVIASQDFEGWFRCEARVAEEVLFAQFLWWTREQPVVLPHMLGRVTTAFNTAAPDLRGWV